MIEASEALAEDALAEPDLVLAVVAPVARRRIGVPPAVPAPLVALPGVPQPPPVPAPLPPPVPAADPISQADPILDASQAVVAAGEEAATGIWPDRDWWVSTGASLVVHVVVLTLLALLVPAAESLTRPRPIEIAQAVVDPEQVPFDDPDEMLPLEVLPPDQDEPVEAPVESADSFVGADADDAAFAAGDIAVDGMVALEADGMLANIGGAGAAGGLGGDVGRRLARAGAKSGDVQISLAWNNGNDLDIHVIAPSGERIYFGHRGSRCRGMLDVDMNAGGALTREPVENIYWPARAAPRGDYQVFVHHFARHDEADETPFDVHVLLDGTRRRYSGSVRSGEPPVPVARFERDGTAGSVHDMFGE